MKKADYLKTKIEHIDITSFDATPVIEQYSKTAFQARNLARAAKIYDRMLADNDCTVILCIAGSLVSAGLKKVICDMIEYNMADVVVATGANVVDQDFFEGLGFHHYQGTPRVDDDDLFRKHIDRIYDTYIDEDELRICDMTVAKIADSIEPRPYSSREFIEIMGKYLDEHKKESVSFVRNAYKKGVPIFVPAFSDCSAGFGLVYHQMNRGDKPKVTIDSAKDFLELTKIKIAAGETGLFMLGGGVPKNFAQDVVVAADILGKNVHMHKYAVQITVADERDGGLSGSTLKEAHSWGKVDEGFEQMVFAEVTLAAPLIVSYAYHKGNWKKRRPKNFNLLLNTRRI
ncbi:MAG: deoxyhypusine synthase [Candidatus Bilamarchaeaceae archaeon]